MIKYNQTSVISSSLSHTVWNWSFYLINSSKIAINFNSFPCWNHKILILHNFVKNFKITNLYNLFLIFVKSTCSSILFNKATWVKRYVPEKKIMWENHKATYTKFMERSYSPTKLLLKSLLLKSKYSIHISKKFILALFKTKKVPLSKFLLNSVKVTSKHGKQLFFCIQWCLILLLDRLQHMKCWNEKKNLTL